jgi:hypothetical protein
MNLDFAPVVETSASDCLVIGAKPKLADKVQWRKSSAAQTGDVAGVWWNLGLCERDV